MAKLIYLVVLVLVAGGLIIGIVTQVTSLIDRVDNLSDLDLGELETETTGLDEMNLTNLLPLMQIFMGRAVALDQIELPKATQITAGDLNLTLPPGWDIAQDQEGADKVYQTQTSTIVMVEDKDGDFAIISTSEVDDPEGFLSDTMNRQAFLLETSGFEIDAYTVLMPHGQQAQAVDVWEEDLVIQIRGWVSGDEVTVINLTTSPGNLAVSEPVFGSIS